MFNPPNRQARIELDQICRELSKQFIEWWDSGKDVALLPALEDAVINYKNAKRAYDHAR